jgi:hypothetical protein
MNQKDTGIRPRLVPVDFNNDNAYYEWGTNVSILGFSMNEAAKLLNERNTQVVLLSRDFDDFWEGYYYGPSRRVLIEEDPF